MRNDYLVNGMRCGAPTHHRSLWHVALLAVRVSLSGARRGGYVHGIARTVIHRLAASNPQIQGGQGRRKWRARCRHAHGVTRPVPGFPGARVRNTCTHTVPVCRTVHTCSRKTSQVSTLAMTSGPAAGTVRPRNDCRTPYREQRPAVEDGDARRLAGVGGRVAHRGAAPVAPPGHDDAVGVHVRLSLEPGGAERAKRVQQRAGKVIDGHKRVSGVVRNCWYHSCSC